jgi:hypothetical protein
LQNTYQLWYSLDLSVVILSIGAGQKRNLNSRTGFWEGKMSIYETLTDSFLAARNELPEAIWNDSIHAFVDESFESAAISVYSNPQALNDFDDSDYAAKIDESISKICDSRGLEYLDILPLTKMMLDLDWNFPIVNVFGMALADGDAEKVSQTWTHCVHAIWFEFSKLLLESPGKQNALRLCRTLDLIEEFELVMIHLEFFSSNYIPLCGLDYWFQDICMRADEYLTHEDVLRLSKSAGKPTLVSMHSSVPKAKWLGEEFAKGATFLANNPNLPSKVVNDALLNREWGYSDNFILHPNADSKVAVEWVTEILDSGDWEELLHSLREWENTRDDVFNNFNSYRSTSESGSKVLLVIKMWCEKNPDDGQEIHEMLFEEDLL